MSSFSLPKGLQHFIRSHIIRGSYLFIQSLFSHLYRHTCFWQTILCQPLRVLVLQLSALYPKEPFQNCINFFPMETSACKVRRNNQLSLFLPNWKPKSRDLFYLKYSSLSSLNAFKHTPKLPVFSKQSQRCLISKNTKMKSFSSLAPVNCLLPEFT